MKDIKLGQVRKWIADTNNERFIIFKDDGMHYGTHYWIIQYLTDGRKQTKAENDFSGSVMSDTNYQVYKYWFSPEQSDGGLDVSYVLVDEQYHILK